MGAHKERPMKKEDVFRNALLMMNIIYDDIKDNTSSLEISNCKAYFDTAFFECSTARRWSFLMRSKDYDDFSYSNAIENLPYVVHVPDDLAYVCMINGEYNRSYRIIGEELYCDTEPKSIQYISTDVDITECPDMFGMLVACMLASDIAPFISPDSNMQNKCLSQYQIRLSALIKFDEMSTRRRNLTVEEMI